MPKFVLFFQTIIFEYMKQTSLISIFSILFLLFIWSSCDNNEITKLKLNKSAISLNVGQLDTLTATVTFTGELSKQTIEWIVGDTTIISTTVINDGSTELEKSASMIEKNIAIKAKKAGSTSITLKTGSKTITCQLVVTQRNLVFTKALASNWGDYYDIGLNNFTLLMYENGLTRAADGKFSGTGNYIFFDFNVPITQNNLYNGNFTASDKGEINTFFQGEYFTQNGENYVLGSFLDKFVSGKSNKTILKDGSYKISTKNGGFVVEGDLTLENDEVIHFIYDGAISIADKRDVAEVKPSLTHGLLYYLGDAYKTTKSNNFLIYLASETLNFQDTLTKGDILALEINCSLNAKDSIPNGTYLAMTELVTEKILPNTFTPGYYSEDNNEYGTWFYGEKITKKIKSGNILFNKIGKNYNISYELYDRFGAKVWGTFKGELLFKDLTVNNIKASSNVSRSTKVKSLKNVKQSLQKRKVIY